MGAGRSGYARVVGLSAVGSVEFGVGRMVVVAASGIGVHGRFVVVQVANVVVRCVLMTAAALDCEACAGIAVMQMFAPARERHARGTDRRQQIDRQQRQSLYRTPFHSSVGLLHAANIQIFCKTIARVRQFLRRGVARARIYCACSKMYGPKLLQFCKKFVILRAIRALWLGRDAVGKM